MIQLNEQNLSLYVDSIARIHISAYHKDHFTSGFSLKKLQEFYKTLIVKNNFCYVYKNDNDKILGFIISGFHTGESVKEFIKRNKFYLITKVLFKPKFLFKKAIGFLKIKQKNHRQGSKAKLRLLSIAVDATGQSRGIGAEMLNYFEKQLLEKDILIYGLSVKESNEAAVRFYKRQGFIHEKTKNKNIFFIKEIKK